MRWESIWQGRGLPQGSWKAKDVRGSEGLRDSWCSTFPFKDLPVDLTSFYKTKALETLLGASLANNHTFNTLGAFAGTFNVKVWQEPWEEAGGLIPPSSTCISILLHLLCYNCIYANPVVRAVSRSKQWNSIYYYYYFSCLCPVRLAL